MSAALWRTSRRIRTGGRIGTVTGPLVMAVVAGPWTGLVVLGWALVYWPHIRPDGIHEKADGYVDH
ncbi:hypothetical protein ACVV2G_32315 [Streptomyces ziwulingensis]